VTPRQRTLLDQAVHGGEVKPLPVHRQSADSLVAQGLFERASSGGYRITDQGRAAHARELRPKVHRDIVDRWELGRQRRQGKAGAR
jgi:hypothetical protein